MAQLSDPDRWTEAAGAWDELGCPWLAACARWRLGRGAARVRRPRRGGRGAAAAGAGDRPRAGGVAVAGELELLARRADRAGTGTGGRRWRAWPDAAEAEVQAPVAEGRTSRQIADALCISGKTASVRVSAGSRRPAPLRHEVLSIPLLQRTAHCQSGLATPMTTVSWCPRMGLPRLGWRSDRLGDPTRLLARESDRPAERNLESREVQPWRPRIARCPARESRHATLVKNAEMADQTLKSTPIASRADHSVHGQLVSADQHGAVREEPLDLPYDARTPAPTTRTR